MAIQHEEARGWQVESVESENRGFDLISRRPDPEDPKTFIEVRFIEVKSRAGVGVVALSQNEYRTAERLKGEERINVTYHSDLVARNRLSPKPSEINPKADALSN